MILTLGLCVIISAVFLLHAQEFTRLIQKLIKLPGFKLLAPIIFASWLIETYEDWSRWALLFVQTKLDSFLQNSSELLWFQPGSEYFVRIIALFLLASVPAGIIWLKTKGRASYSLPYLSRHYSAALWIIAVLLLVIHPS